MTAFETPVLKNIESGQIIEINKSPFTIGRGLNCDCVIESRVVSRTHCSLVRKNEGWVLRDSSTNGTLVNDLLVLTDDSPILKNNDEICLGFHSCTYKFLAKIEKVQNSQVEKLKSQEVCTTSKNTSPISPGSPNSFDENGISDEVLNGVADDILLCAEGQNNKPTSEIPNKPVTIQENNEPTHEVASETNIPESDIPGPSTVSSSILEQPEQASWIEVDINRPSNSSSIFQQDHEPTYQYNNIVDPVAVMLQPSQWNTDNFDQSESSTNIPMGETHVGQTSEVLNKLESTSDISDATVTYSVPDDVPTEFPLIFNAIPLVSTAEPIGLPTAIQDACCTQASSSSGSTVTYSLPELLPIEVPSVSSSNTLGLTADPNSISPNVPTNFDTVDINFTTAPDTNFTMAPVFSTSNLNGNSNTTNTQDITDSVERFNIHFAQTLDDVVKKYTVEMDSLVADQPSTSNESNSSTSTVTANSRNIYKPKQHYSMVQSTSSTSAKSSVSVTSPSNANKKVKIMTTTPHSLATSTSASVGNKKRNLVTVPPPLTTYNIPVRTVTAAELEKMLTQKGVTISHVQLNPSTTNTLTPIAGTSGPRRSFIRPAQNNGHNSSIQSTSNSLHSRETLDAIQKAIFMKNTPSRIFRPGTTIPLNCTVSTDRNIVDPRNTLNYLTNSLTVQGAGGITPTRLFVHGNYICGDEVSSTTVDNIVVPINSYLGPNAPITSTVEVLESQELPVANHEVISNNNTTETGNSSNAKTVAAIKCHNSQEASTSKAPDKVEPTKEEPSKQQNQVRDQNQYEEMENELMCTICANLFIKAVTLGCSHSFCQYCIDMWKKKKSECPICRTKIVSTIKTLVLDNIIEKMLESAPLEDRQQRDEAVKERKKIEETENAPKNKQNNRRGTNTARRGRRQGNNNARANNNPPPAEAQARPVINLTDSSASSVDLTDSTESPSPDTTDTEDSSDSSNTSASTIINLTDSPESPESPSTTDSEGDEDYDYGEYYDDNWYNGRPGAYFGGYGRCYNCGDRGHWSNGCPYR